MVTFIPLNCPSPEIMTRLLKIIQRLQRTEGSLPVADVSKNSTTQTPKNLAVSIARKEYLSKIL